MPRNGSGSYNLPGNSWNPAVPGTTIESSAANQTLPDIASALTQSLSKDGQTMPTNNITMAGFKITNLGPATATTDVVNLSQLQSVNQSLPVATVSGTANAIALTVTPALTAYADGQAFLFTATANTTGPTTISVSSLSAEPVLVGGASVASFDIASGDPYIAVRKGGAWNIFASHGQLVYAHELAEDANTGNVRAVSSTADTILASDRGKLVIYSAVSSVTIPQATGSFAAPYYVTLAKTGTGVATFTPTTSTIDGATSLSLSPGQSTTVYSDGANYETTGTQAQGLAANQTYYVRTDGSDSNNGLANTSGGAWLTLQHAWNVATALNLNGFTVTIQVGDGTYTGGVSASGLATGQKSSGQIVFQGNSGTPGNVIISVTGTQCFDGTQTAFTVKDMELRTATSGECLRAGTGTVISYSGIRFGTCAGTHVNSNFNSTIRAIGAYSIVGGAQRHWSASNNANIDTLGVTVTLTGTPAFSTQFATSSELGDMRCANMTFTGSATGVRYSVILNAVINTGGGANYLPGNSAGSVATGGVYA